MTRVKFSADGERLSGFEISGHCSSDSDDMTGKIVCAAVSSAAYMAANTVTEIIGDAAKAEIDDAVMKFRVINPSDAAVKVLEGLKLHLEQLSGQYGSNIKIYGGAKHVKD